MAWDRLHDAPVEPCADLKARNVKSMVFIGDSYVRHVYQNMGAWLANNYRNASVSPDASQNAINFKCNKEVSECGTNQHNQHSTTPLLFPRLSVRMVQS